MRLDKYLADMGAGTRSELKKEIRKGLAKVDGKPVTDPGFSVNERSEVIFRGENIAYAANIYIMLHKPAGVITATEDNFQKTVLDLIDEPTRNDLFPVGRLDKDTEGLLLITNDGETAHRLLSPKRHVDKTYFARIAGEVTKADAEAFEEGLKVDEELNAMPAKLEILSIANAKTDGVVSEVLITIREGKFHQIKRMFLAVGKEVIYLKRISMGPLTLDENLKCGEYRELTADEVSKLRKI